MDAQDQREDIEGCLAHHIPDEPFPKFIDEEVFLEIRGLLKKHPDKLIWKPWRKNPRLYTLLRMLGYHEDTTVFQHFVTEKIGDVWLPIGSATLSQLASSVDISPKLWQKTQLHVLSKPQVAVCTVIPCGWMLIATV